jgi:CRISPR-associated protein Cas6/Cse3/CasE subtype I-E
LGFLRPLGWPLLRINGRKSIVPFFGSKGAFRRTLTRRSGFIHSALSFTRLEVPALEYYETAVAFAPDTDPITAHREIADVFGQKAGEGEFLFRADSSIAGRYWVHSAAQWRRWPATAVSALEPKRILIQLAEGLMYRFTLQVCAGRAKLAGTEKVIEPYSRSEDVAAWLRSSAPRYGFTPLMLDVSMQALRFTHRGQKARIDFAQIEGALEVADPVEFKRRVAQGFGHHRRAGLGLMQLMA